MSMCSASSVSTQTRSRASPQRAWCDRPAPVTPRALPRDPAPPSTTTGRLNQMAYRRGVDVGGTFTDLFLVDDAGMRQWRAKTPSTPAEPSEGVLTGVERICREAGISAADLRNIVHGTTVATNAVLEGKGARVGL